MSSLVNTTLHFAQQAGITDLADDAVILFEDELTELIVRHSYVLSLYCIYTVIAIQKDVLSNNLVERARK
jgi:hypothetical protein